MVSDEEESPSSYPTDASPIDSYGTRSDDSTVTSPVSSEDLFGDVDDSLFDDAGDEVAQTGAVEPAGIAELARDPAESAAADRASNTKRMAWLLGSKLSLAVLANDRGAPADDVAKWFGDSHTLATLLGTTVSDLPQPPPNANVNSDPEQALNYLFSQGQQVGRDLANFNGDDHAALFELAVKSNILLALYQPNAPVVDALAEALKQAGERSGLPVELWQPLLDALDAHATRSDVHDAVFRLHADADRFLSVTP